MTKITASVGLAAVLLSSAVALPAFAMSDFDEDFLIRQLQDRGVQATDVYDHSDNVIRAVVQTADGATTFEYFYEDTLQPVAASGTESRVLSKVDNGVSRAAHSPSTVSLINDPDKND